jgi:hypothetical protein
MPTAGYHTIMLTHGPLSKYLFAPMQIRGGGIV